MSIKISGLEILPSETNMIQDKVNSKFVYHIYSKYILQMLALLRRGYEKQDFKDGHIWNWMLIYLMKERVITTELISYFHEKPHDKYWHYWTSNMNAHLAFPGFINTAVKQKLLVTLYILSNNMKMKNYL